MKFMLFTYRDPTTTLDPAQRAAIPAAVEAWCSEMDQRGFVSQGTFWILRPKQRPSDVAMASYW